MRACVTTAAGDQSVSLVEIVANNLLDAYLRFETSERPFRIVGNDPALLRDRTEAIADWAAATRIGLVVVGPEAPLALRLAGVNRATREVAGGAIVRAGGGEPTGILKDNAQSLVARVVPDPPAALEDRALDTAMTYVASNGVTSVHNMGSWSDVAIFERARAAGRLRTRIYAAVPLSTWERLRDTVQARGRGDEWLRIGGLKGFVDGSLGSHTAAMLEPFTDAPNDRGLFVNTPEDLYRWTSGADQAGLHVMIHAIGDRAIRALLDQENARANERARPSRRKVSASRTAPTAVRRRLRSSSRSNPRPRWAACMQAAAYAVMTWSSLAANAA